MLCRYCPSYFQSKEVTVMRRRQDHGRSVPASLLVVNEYPSAADRLRNWLKGCMLDRATGNDQERSAGKKLRACAAWQAISNTCKRG
jgi:hypothetical protein